MNRIVNGLAVGACLTLLSAARAGAQPAGAVRLPVIPERRCSLAEYGGTPDSETLSTAALERAIDACAARGGGRVVVPPGLWLTGPIVLRSRIDLHLERGALVIFTPQRSEYPLEASEYEGGAGLRCRAPLSGQGLEDVAITGEGIFDGSGQVWRPVKKSKMTAGQWQTLVESGGVLGPAGDIWWPSAGARDGRETLARIRAGGREPTAAESEGVRDFLRPVLLSLRSCRRVLLQGVTFQNSPAWCLHPLMCEDVTVRDVTVRNPWYAQNGDGLDIESCRNVLVEGSRFDVGDDAICLKSGRDARGRERARPTEDVLVRDCVVDHGHGGFVVGSEMSGGVRRVEVRDCTFVGTDTGLRFKSRRGRGGIVQDIVVSGVRMVDIATQAIVFDLFYGDGADATADGVRTVEADVETPRFENIRISNVTCRGARQALLLRGLPEMPLKGLTFEKVDIAGETGAVLQDVQGARLVEVVIRPAHGPVFALNNSRDIVIERARVPTESDPFLRVSGARSADLAIIATDLARSRSAIELAEEVKGLVVRTH